MMTAIDIAGAMSMVKPMAAPAAAPVVQSDVNAPEGAGDFASVMSQTQVSDGHNARGEIDADVDTGGGESAEQVDLSILAALFAVYPQITQEGQNTQVPWSAQALPDEAIRPDIGARTVDTGNVGQPVTILEGTAIDGTNNNGDPKLADVTDVYAGEDLARMPQIRTRTDIQQTAEGRDTQPVDILDDMPCPLENVNGEEQAPEARGGEERRQESPGDETARDDAGKWSYALPAGAAVDAAPERVSAAEQLKAARPEQPVARESLFDAMVERLEVMREDGLPQMTVELKPEYLGRVTLNLTAAPSGGVNLRISAADPGVKGMIDGQIAALVEELSGKGVRLERVDVVYTGVGSGGYDGLGERTGEGKRGNARGGRSGRYASGVSAASAPAAAIELLRAAGLDAEYSEYEYSA
ncbi:MAG: flagellar hook-length control protein FliK [Oscillospiraceae bacterium]|jgi:hypothetical protein|nr:flagellar hook-length control protein FliK [Oscillospiraceae bacterium]